MRDTAEDPAGYLEGKLRSFPAWGDGLGVAVAGLATAGSRAAWRSGETGRSSTSTLATAGASSTPVARAARRGRWSWSWKAGSRTAGAFNRRPTRQRPDRGVGQADDDQAGTDQVGQALAAARPGPPTSAMRPAGCCRVAGSRPTWWGLAGPAGGLVGSGRSLLDIAGPPDGESAADIPDPATATASVPLRRRDRVRWTGRWRSAGRGGRRRRRWCR